ncbi:MAG TPA: hypothetical protein VFB02_05875 [Bradyrhizobium sp.]|nr:hypothetical protein [Bradyrhizobium sp.]
MIEPKPSSRMCGCMAWAAEEMMPEIDVLRAVPILDVDVGELVPHRASCSLHFQQSGHRLDSFGRDGDQPVQIGFRS